MRRFNPIATRFGRPTSIKTPTGTINKTPAFSRQQAIFNEQATKYAPHGVISTPSYLRLEQTAPNSSINSISFQTLATSGTVTSTERRLKLADSFTITDIAFYLGSSLAVGYVSGAADYAKQTLHTFPSPEIFTTKADELEVLYNGFLSLRIDSTTFLDSIPMRQFYRVGTSQQQTAAANVPQIQRDEWTSNLYGKAELLPTITLGGQQNIEFTINLPDGVNIAGAAATQNINLVLILTGFLNQGASQLQGKR